MTVSVTAVIVRVCLDLQAYLHVQWLRFEIPTRQRILASQNLWKHES